MAATISDTGFYAVVDFSISLKRITQIGYYPGANIYNPPGTVVLEPADIALYGIENPAPDDDFIRTPFEAFLQTLYFAGVSLASESKKFDLDSEMIAAGVDSQYAGVQVADFMAFTGALKRYQTLKNGNQIDLLGLQPGDVRPNLNDLEKNEDFYLMYGIIDHLGIHGMLPYLYIREGITFKQFSDRFRVWKDDTTSREDFVYNRLQPILRNNNAPVLSETDINNLIKE